MSSDKAHRQYPSVLEFAAIAAAAPPLCRYCLLSLNKSQRSHFSCLKRNVSIWGKWQEQEFLICSKWKIHSECILSMTNCGDLGQLFVWPRTEAFSLHTNTYTCYILRDDFCGRILPVLAENGTHEISQYKTLKYTCTFIMEDNVAGEWSVLFCVCAWTLASHKSLWKLDEILTLYIKIVLIGNTHKSKW